METQVRITLETDASRSHFHVQGSVENAETAITEAVASGRSVMFRDQNGRAVIFGNEAIQRSVITFAVVNLAPAPRGR